MVLAHRGIEIGEAELVRRTSLDEGGLTPEELVELARSCGLDASEQQVGDQDLVDIVATDHFPIVYLYRKYLDGAAAVHAVIPVRFSKHFVTFLDPLRGKRRVSIKKFAKARSLVQRWVIVFAD
jgi:ABC-type bacteriocin/lantibiotic exporter with double-glycine peptidase domain